jgi:putative oxidoreductase
MKEASTMLQEATLTPPAATIGRGTTVFAWLCQLGIALILLQTLYFKFTFAPETQLIFAKLGGRPAATVAGIAELVCAVLLLWPGRAAWGALLALGVMGGAIATHLFVIGIEVVDPATGRGDGGLLFGLALAVTVLSTIVLFLRRGEVLETLGRVL